MPVGGVSSSGSVVPSFLRLAFPFSPQPVIISALSPYATCISPFLTRQVYPAGSQPHDSPALKLTRAALAGHVSEFTPQNGWVLAHYASAGVDSILNLTPPPPSLTPAPPPDSCPISVHMCHTGLKVSDERDFLSRRGSHQSKGILARNTALRT